MALLQVRPSIVPPEDPDQRIVLTGCRHPCVERMEGVGFIKNDVCLRRGAGGTNLQVHVHARMHVYNMCMCMYNM